MMRQGRTLVRPVIGATEVAPYCSALLKSRPTAVGPNFSSAMTTSMTATDAILEKAIAGETLSPADVAAVHATADVLALGMAADEVRRHRHGARTTFLRVEVRPVESVTENVVLSPTAGEIRLVGSLGDREYAVTAIRRVVAATAGRTPVHGFSLADVEAAAGADRTQALDLLKSLRDAGLERLAEAPLDALQSADAMIDVTERAGLGVARATIERAPADSRPALIDRAARILRDHPAIVAFAPLPRRIGVQPSTGFEDVRLVALTRLLVDVPHVQVDWQLYGPKLAQVALTFGADDVDNVSPLDDAPDGKRRAPLEEIRRNIVAASGEPIERDGRFELRA
jgi:aminodeoxyfutalosine synthase